jgi:diaminopimelate epimerase
MKRGPRLVKISGAGNDFIVIGPEELQFIEGDIASWVRRVCRRRLSVGADGVLLVAPSGKDHVSVRFRNPDGSMAFCGNGSRCAARYAHMKGFAGKKMVLETLAGDVPAEILEDGVRLELPAPVDRGKLVLELSDGRLEGRYILAGAPHFVSWTDDLTSSALERLGPPVRRHPEFGVAGANFDLIAKGADGSLAVRTWERGVEGETLSCGSGAVAAALAYRLEGGGERVRIIPASGLPLTVTLPGGRRIALLEGDARVIYEGEMSLEAARG